MPYMVTRRYLIDADSEAELYQLAINHVRDEDEATALEEAADAGHAAMTAGVMLASMFEVGDATEVVTLYDDLVLPAPDAQVVADAIFRSPNRIANNTQGV